MIARSKESLAAAQNDVTAAREAVAEAQLAVDTAQEALAACPDGWRLPGSTEYTALENYAISVTGASSRYEVKKVIPWFEMKSGFNMPDGTRYWTSEKFMDGVQDRYDMYYHFAIINGSLDRYPDDAWRGKQVRCVRN